MKVTCLLLWLFVLQVSAHTYAQRINIQVTNADFEDVILKMQQQSGYNFLYASELIKEAKPVTLNLKDAPLADALKQCLANQPFAYVINNRTVTLTAKAGTKPPAVITVTGKVTDDKDLPLPGVTIKVKNTTIATISNGDGTYQIKVPDQSAVLVFTSIGFENQEITVGKQTQINVSLKTQITGLNETVVIGYGQIQRRDLTGAVSSVTAKQLKDIPITSLGEALAGRLAGVQITQSEGSPDADVRVRVRGGGSITQDNSPLYIIDGVQVESGLSSLSPQDIETIDVLKDAASTAIYGARGANGVVMITTKGGRKMKTLLSYNGFAGFSKLSNELPVLSPYDFVVYQYERSRGSLQDSSSFYYDYGHNFDTLAAYKNKPFIDWQQRAMGRDAFQQTHNFSLVGGTDATQFNVSFTNNEQQGIVVNSDYRRNLLNFRFDHTANPWLRVGFNARYNSTVVAGAGVSNSSNTPALNNLRNIVKYRPFNQGNTPDDQVDQYYLSETNLAGNNLGVINPLQLANAQYRRTYNDILNLNGYVNLTFSKYISFKSTLGLDFNNNKQNSFDDVITPNARINGSGQPLAGINTLGVNTQDWSNVITYSNSAAHSAHHSINVILGNEFYNITAQGLNSQFKLFPIGISAENALNQLALGQTIPTYPQVTNYTSHLLSFFARANYTFNQRYLFSATMRSDQSSKFSEGHRNGYFPSGSFAWRISDESFMKDFHELSDLKLRLSYGTSGNNRIADYLYSSVFNANALYSLNESTTTIGFTTPYLPNPNLKWETTISRNIGLDFGLFNSRLQVSLDAYNNSTKNLLINVPVPTSSGYATQLQNVGQTSNKGAEVQINASVMQSKAFSWTANFNVSYNENKIVALAPGQQSYLQASGWAPSGQPADFIVQVGQAVGSVYGYQSDGFYTVNDFNYNTTNHQYTLKPGVADPSAIQGVPEPGLIKFKDLNGDGKITDADRKVLGTTNPKITGGLNQQFTYKNFDMSVFLNFQAAAKVLNASKIEFTSGYSYNTNLLGLEADRWRTIDASGNVVEKVVLPTGSSTRVAVGVPPDQLAALNANAKYAIPGVTGSAAFFVTSDALENAAFVRVNNVTLGYTFKLSILQRLKINRLRVYVTGNNLALITSYTGYDPDVNTRRGTPVTPGVDYSAYPRSRVYIAGVQLSL